MIRTSRLWERIVIIGLLLSGCGSPETTGSSATLPPALPRQPTGFSSPVPTASSPIPLIPQEDLSSSVLVFGRSNTEEHIGIHFMVNLVTGKETYLAFEENAERAVMWDSVTGWVYFPSLRKTNLFTGEVVDSLEFLGISRELDPYSWYLDWLNFGRWIGIWQIPEGNGSRSLNIYSLEESTLLFGPHDVPLAQIEDGASSRNFLAFIYEHSNWEDFPNTTYPSDLFVVEARSGDVILQISDEPGQLAVSWSPDGELLAVVSSYYGTLAGDGPINGEFLEIWDVTKREVVYRFVGHYDHNEETAGDGPASFAEIQWSSDGSFIVFTNVDWDGRFISEICVLTLETRANECLISSTGEKQGSYKSSPRMVAEDLVAFLQTDQSTGCRFLVTASIGSQKVTSLSGNLCIFGDILPDLAGR